MSVTIEINRSRIDSHHKFTQGIYILESNVDDVQFCLKVFYLPCLKNLVTKTEKYNEVCMWYVQMVCYHVHVPLLLRLSNKY
jgi:hypothetical protein